MDQFINRAYFRLVERAPFLFFDDILEFPVYPDVASGANDTLQMAENPGAVSKDPWVLESVSLTSATTTTFNTDGLWGGRTIYLFHTDTNRWHKRVIREVFTDISTNKYYITLDHPWLDEDVVTKWRIEMGSFVLPHQVISIKHLAETRSPLYTDIEVVPAGEAEDFEADPDRLGLHTGNLRSAYRREHRALPAPTFEPTATEDAQNAWAGPEPLGTFEYCFAYGWGYQDTPYQEAGPETQNQVYVAGSSPRPVFHLVSPPSATTGTVDNSSAGGEIDVTLPDVDFTLGFADNTTRRYRRAGLKKIIFRRRAVSAPGSGFDRNIETPEDFYPIAIVDGHIQTWTDDGTLTPDYSAPLMVTHGYQTLQFWPRPYQNTSVRMRALVRPKPLTDTNDFPRIHEDAVDCLINLALVYLHEGQSNFSMAQYYEGKVRENLETLTKRYGTAVPGGQPRRIGAARASRRRHPASWMRLRSN